MQRSIGLAKRLAKGTDSQARPSVLGSGEGFEGVGDEVLERVAFANQFRPPFLVG